MAILKYFKSVVENKISSTAGFTAQMKEFFLFRMWKSHCPCVNISKEVYWLNIDFFVVYFITEGLQLIRRTQRVRIMVGLITSLSDWSVFRYHWVHKKILKLLLAYWRRILCPLYQKLKNHLWTDYEHCRLLRTLSSKTCSPL